MANLEINTDGYICRNINNIIFHKTFSDNNAEELLLNIRKDENNNYELITNEFKIDENKMINSHNNCWFLLQKSKIGENAGKYKMKKGDIIRFGRLITRVKEIKIKKNFNLNNNNSINLNNNINIININNNLNNQNNQNNEIINKKDETKINILNLSSELKKQSYIKLDEKTKGKLNIKNLNLIKTSQSIKKVTKIQISKKICRICYDEEDPVGGFDNPLVQPCQCSGSLKYIHLKCLKHWLRTKACDKLESNFYFEIYLIKKVKCEICKSNFSDFIQHNKKIFEVLDLESAFENYLELESLVFDKNNNRCIYVINLDNNIKINLGRGHDAHLIINDMSVSRLYCTLTVENKNIYLEDNNSKFGTLVLVQTPTLKLIENLPLFIQIGRTFLECMLKKPFSLFSCCEVNEKPNNNYYYQQNDIYIENNLLNIITVKTDNVFSEKDYEINDEEEEKNYINLKTQENETKNDKRFDEMTVDIDNLNSTRLRMSKEENDIKINVARKSKSLFNINENNIDIKINKEEKSKDEINDKISDKINKSESIILESESDVIN